MIILDEHGIIDDSITTDEHETEENVEAADEPAILEEFNPANEVAARQWLLLEKTRLEQKQAELESEKAKLEQQKKDFELEQNIAEQRNRATQQQLEREQNLFQMKWRVLEEELKRLAADRKKIEREREEIEALKASQPVNDFQYSMFFVGVTNRLMLKKRYRDLIKIFHPDNIAGDNETLQEINREYEELQEIFI